MGEQPVPEIEAAKEERRRVVELARRVGERAESEKGYAEEEASLQVGLAFLDREEGKPSGVTAHLEEADRRLQGQTSPPYRTEGYAHIIGLLLKYGFDPQDALKKGLESSETISREGTDLKWKALANIAAAFVKGGRREEGLKLAEQFSTNDFIRFDVYQAITLAEHGRGEDFQESLGKVREVLARLQRSLGEESTTEFVQLLARLGRYDEANALQKTLRPGLYQRDPAVEVLSIELAKAGRPDEALALAESLDWMGKDTAVNYVVQTLGSMGDVSRTREAAAKLSATSDVSLKVNAVGSIARALARSGDVQGAKDEIEKEIAFNKRWKPEDVMRIYRFYIDGLIDGGNLQEAVRAVDQYIQGDHWTTYFTQRDIADPLFRALIGSGQLDQAEKFAEKYKVNTVLGNVLMEKLA